MNCISLKNVNFTYPTRPTMSILNGMNVEVEKGQKVALVGSSGCGKSTIINLLERFYNVKSGIVVRILITNRLFFLINIRKMTVNNKFLTVEKESGGIWIGKRWKNRSKKEQKVEKPQMGDVWCRWWKDAWWRWWKGIWYRWKSRRIILEFDYLVTQVLNILASFSFVNRKEMEVSNDLLKGKQKSLDRKFKSGRRGDKMERL